MKWIPINKQRPELGPGEHSVKILVATFEDELFFNVSTAMYGYVQKFKLWENSKLDKDFFIFEHPAIAGLPGSDNIPMRVFDPITHWAYMPEPPTPAEMEEVYRDNGHPDYVPLAQRIQDELGGTWFRNIYVYGDAKPKEMPEVDSQRNLWVHTSKTDAHFETRKIRPRGLQYNWLDALGIDRPELITAHYMKIRIRYANVVVTSVNPPCFWEYANKEAPNGE